MHRNMPAIFRGALRSPRCGHWTTALLALAAALHTVSGVTLAWDPSPDAGVAGYAVLHGTTSSNYTERVDVGNVTSATISNLTEGVTYFFVAVAYTTDGLESLPSNEVAYTVPFLQTNAAPVVTVGADQTITFPSAATLTATVVDDGLPAAPGAVTVSWSVVSGPGAVTFQNADAAGTAASFSSAGTYVLRLTANDGALTSFADLAVTVLSAVIPPNTAGRVTLAWDPSPDAGVAGYAIRYGTASSNYTERVDVGNVTSATISNLTEGVTYFFVAVAYTTDGLESLPSNEVAYTVPFLQTNAAPVVTVGADQTITFPSAATLTATVVDDGLPAAPGAVTVSWSVVSGPGAVTFSAPANATTVASFSAAGVYVLRLIATDGALSASDDVTVTVTALVTIAGTIKTYAGQPVAGVAVTLSGDSAQTTTTASDGTYAFMVAPGGNYTVTPAKTDDMPCNLGITSADNSLIQRQILGLGQLGSPYKLLAADVNASKTITSADNSLIQRIILGLATNLTSGLWRFVPADFVFADPLAPSSFATNREYSMLASTVANQDFVAMKMGDVNGTWTPPVTGSTLQLKSDTLTLRTTGPVVTFAAPSQTVLPGQIVTVPIIVSNFQKVASAQFSLRWEATVLQFLSVSNYTLPGLGAGNFNGTSAGKLAFAWAGLGSDLMDGTAMFTVQFKVTGGNETMSPLAFVDSPTPREVSVNGSIATFSGVPGRITVSENTQSWGSGIQIGPDGRRHIQFVGVPGRVYSVEYCENLSSPSWLPLGEAMADAQGRFEFVDTPPAAAVSRFYRLVYANR